MAEVITTNPKARYIVQWHDHDHWRNYGFPELNAEIAEKKGRDLYILKEKQMSVRVVKEETLCDWMRVR